MVFFKAEEVALVEMAEQGEGLWMDQELGEKVLGA